MELLRGFEDFRSKMQIQSMDDTEDVAFLTNLVSLNNFQKKIWL